MLSQTQLSYSLTQLYEAKFRNQIFVGKTRDEIYQIYIASHLSEIWISANFRDELWRFLLFFGQELNLT